MDRRSQAFGGRWSRLQAFGGIRGSSFQKPLVADGVIHKPLVAYVDRSVQGFSWRALIVVQKPLVASVDCRLQAFGGLRGSPFTSLWWQMESFTSLWGHTWIGVYMPLVSYVDRSLQALDGLRGSPFTSLWWQMESFKGLWGYTGILVSRAFGGGWRHLQAFGGIR